MKTLIEATQEAEKIALPPQFVVHPVALPAAGGHRTASPHAGRRTGVWIRRALNFTIALAALVVLSPLLLLIATMIRLTSPGPIIYRQTRVGIDRRTPGVDLSGGRRRVDYGGKLFTIYKFRTMRADPQSVIQIWAKPGDSRVTPLGRVLRKYRLDELPQLVNVVLGQMNIVGPRPEQPRIFMELRDLVPGYAERQRVLPGITGWAQIHHQYDRCLEDVKTKVRYDLEYLRRESPLLDLRILVLTLPVMVFGKGAM